MEAKFLGIDTAAKISARAAKILRSEGISFVARYLVPNIGVTAWKALSAEEAKTIRDADLALMLCWELSADRMKGGSEYGYADGKGARELAEKMGVPSGTVIYFAADWNVTESEYDEVDAYLSQAERAVGNYRVGLYGHENLIHTMAERHSGMMCWQCCAWSNTLDAAADVWQYQWQGGADAKALAEKVGFAVDLDSADALNGMWMPENALSESEAAHKWCVENGIVDESMRDVSQYEIMLYRYHRRSSNGR